MAEENLDKVPDELLADTDNKNFNSFFNYIVSNAAEARERPANHGVMRQNEDGVFKRVSGGFFGAKWGVSQGKSAEELEDVDGELEEKMMTKDDNLAGAYKAFIIEFPSRTNNLVNYNTIDELMEIFRTIRTGPEYIDPRDDSQEGQIEDMRRVYSMLRDAEDRQSTDFIEEIIAKTKPEADR